MVEDDTAFIDDVLLPPACMPAFTPGVYSPLQMQTIEESLEVGLHHLQHSV